MVGEIGLIRYAHPLGKWLSPFVCVVNSFQTYCNWTLNMILTRYSGIYREISGQTPENQRLKLYLKNI